MLDLEAIFKKDRNAIRGVILEYEARYDQVEELIQDTFVAALASQDTFKGDSEPLTWVCGIAKNVARNHVRWCLKQVDMVSEAEFVGGDIESYADTYAASNPNDDPSCIVDANNLLERALSGMPLRTAQAVLMRQEGYSNPDIAEALECSVSSVENDIYKSKQILGEN